MDCRILEWGRTGGLVFKSVRRKEFHYLFFNFDLRHRCLVEDLSMQLHFHESRDLRSSNKVRFLEKKYNFSDILCVAMVAKLGDRFGKLSFHNFHARQYHSVSPRADLRNINS